MKNEMLDRGSLTLSQIVDLLLLNGTLTKCPGLVHGKLRMLKEIYVILVKNIFVNS